MQKDKVESLIGFSVKSGKIIYGKDNLLSGKKRIYLIVMCGAASENIKKDVFNISSTKKIKLLITKKPLENIVFKTNCKVIGLLDRQMSEAIIKNADTKDYELLSLEEKN